MRYAIISDIHSNIEAFDVILLEIKKESPDRILFLGDIVGYGPEPSECIKKIKETTDVILVGNHDHAAAGLTEISYFNPDAKEALEWTIGRLTEEEKTYLSQLPLTGELTADDIFLVHSTPKRPLEWNYIFTIEDVIESFEYFEQRVCFAGHSHVPVIIAMDVSGRIDILKDEAKIEKDSRYLINVGSVGQPRDGNPDAAYALYDSEESTVKIKRVSYSYHKTQEKMRKAGFPDYLIKRLSAGR